MKWGFAISVTIATALLPSLSFASPSAKLVYVRGAGAETCPDEAELRKAVAVRIGYDPFFPVAQKTVIAQVSRAQQGYRARVQIVGEDGKLRGERELGTKGQDCVELASAIALAISVALDDLDDPVAPAPSETAPPPNPDPPVPPSPPVERPRDETPSKPPPLPPANDGPPVDLAALLGVGVVTGTAPSVAASGQISGILGSGPLALRIDGRADAPSGTGLRPNGRLSTTSFIATASVCVRGKIPFFCAGGGPGWIATTTEGLANPRSDGAAIAVAALRAGARIRVSRLFFLEPSVVAGANLVRHDVVVDGAIAYELPFVWAGASLLAGFDFF